jgi:pantetheine-phosphate adenylyltransferase
MTYKTALIVGRFQPPHFGHLFLIKKALEKAEKIVFVIGSASIYDENNPLSFEQRKKMIKEIIKEENISERVLKIIPLEDFFDDKKWLENLKEEVGKFDLVIGNNEWTNKILEEAGYKILRVGHYKRSLYEGWRIRKLMREGKNWRNRVPKYIVSWLHCFIAKNNNGTTCLPAGKVKQFNYVVLGGTFDHFHIGHKALLEKAFEIGKKVTIGIATEELYKNKFLSETIEPFEVRKKSIKEFLKKKDWLSRVKLISFSDFKGGADRIKSLDAIVVSERTYPNALKINQLRKKNNLNLLRIIIIDDVLADDGKLISSERIRAGEIDREGKNYGLRITNYELKNKKELKMPESLREELRKPLGKIFKDEKSLLRCIDTLKYTLIIAIGDIIVDSMLKSGIDPDVKIIDFRSRRRVIPAKAGIYINKSSIKSRLINNPSTINLKTAKVIEDKIKNALYHQEKSWIAIEGEEDLLALPAILFAPLNSLVLYGHWQYGVVAVEVNEKMKEKIIKILKKFN